jgi:serine/threonine protein kinase
MCDFLVSKFAFFKFNVRRYAEDFTKHKPSMRLGTLEYMAPEVLRCDPQARRRLEREGRAGYGPEVGLYKLNSVDS